MRRIFKNIILSAAFISMSGSASAEFKGPKPIADQENWKTVTLYGVTYTYKGNLFDERNGLAIFSGDIILGNIDQVSEDFQQAVRPSSLNLANPQNQGEERALGAEDDSKHALWPDGIIPFKFADDINKTTRYNFKKAVAHVEENTVVRLVELNSKNEDQYTSYLSIVPEKDPANGGSSYVGMLKAKFQPQPFTINQTHQKKGNDGSIGVIIHELGHAIGLWHEQSRSDRDDWVTIHEENIIGDNPMTPEVEDYTGNFATIKSKVGYFDTQYDYESIMHYRECAYSIGGDQCGENERTIVPKQKLSPAVIIGDRDFFSDIDIEAINTMYGGD